MKTILLLTHNLKDFGGSEINILHLAQEFKLLGYDVEVGAFSYGLPIKNYFEKDNLVVKSLLQEEVNLKKYNLLWVQHTPVLNYILFEKSINFDDIIYSSLSPFEPLEVPPVYLQKNISLFLANSKETKKQMISEGLRDDEIKLFPNSVPDDFFNYKETSKNKKIEKFAIVSNHLPPELYELKDLMIKENIVVDIYGLNNINKLITPNILFDYDAIVTIGKTVQFALSMKIPVFIYDKFGADGWVNIDSIDKMEKYNFSGRYSRKNLKAKEIYEELILGYQGILHQTNKLKEIAIKRYSLKENILFAIKETSVFKNIDTNDYMYIKRFSQTYSKLFLENKSYKDIKDKNDVFEEKLYDMQLKFKNQEEKLYETQLKLKYINEHNIVLQKDLKSAYSSFRWRLFYPLDFIREKSLFKIPYLTIKSSRILRILYHSLPLNSQTKRRVRQFFTTGKMTLQGGTVIKEDYVDCSYLQTEDILLKPFVSIIIPCYNQGCYLWESVPSAYASYSAEVEIIIINDGSTDPRSNKCLKEIKVFYPDVIIINKENGGLSSARNEGLKYAKGKYIQFLDADDTLLPGKIDIQIDKRQSSDDILICNYLTANEDYSEFYKTEETIKGYNFGLEDFLYKWERGFSIPLHCGLFPADVLHNINFDEELHAKEDWFLWCSLLSNGAKIHYVDIHACVYRVHDNSMVRQSFLKMSKAWQKAYSKISIFLEENERITFISESEKWLEKYYTSNINYKMEISEANKLDKKMDKNKELEKLNIDLDKQRVLTSFKNFSNDVPIISVIVPIYNHYIYLVECLISVAKQKNVPIELICIDDNSSDTRVSELLKELATISPNVQIIFQKNNYGISRTQNIGVELAKGKYIAFLDCDDYLAQDALATVLEYINKSPNVDYFFSDRVNIDKNGKVLYDAIYDVVKKSTIKNDLLDRMIASHLKVIKKDIYETTGGSDETMSGIQDWDLALKIAECGMLYYIPKKLYFHRLHNDSVTTSESASQYKKTNLLRRRYTKSWLQNSTNYNNIQEILELRNDLSQNRLESLDIKLFTPQNLRINSWYSPRLLYVAFENKKRIVFDARGTIDEEYIDFLKDYNSYFDLILCDRLSVSSQMIGVLWSEKVLYMQCTNH